MAEKLTKIIKTAKWGKSNQKKNIFNDFTTKFNICFFLKTIQDNNFWMVLMATVVTGRYYYNSYCKLV